jgi:hypothetical protein
VMEFDVKGKGEARSQVRRRLKQMGGTGMPARNHHYAAGYDARVTSCRSAKRRCLEKGMGLEFQNLHCEELYERAGTLQCDATNSTVLLN